MAVDKTKQRIRQTGEIFTPIVLVDEILDKLPIDQFTDPNKTFLDPAAGDGNFLVRVVQRKIDNGSTPTQAVQTTYGVELMEDNVRIMTQRILDIVGDTKQHRTIVNKNIICHNSLEWDFENWKPMFDKKEQQLDTLLIF